VKSRSGTLVLAALLTALLVGGPIACGKRGDLQPPPDKPSTWPRPYPNS
jgi:hypothetical protein